MTVNEDNLLGQLKVRNPNALEYLIDTHGAGIYWLVHRILHGTGRQEDVEECVSDVYVDIWNNIHSFDAGKGSLKTWLLIRAKYLALDYRRKLGRTPVTIEPMEESLIKSVEPDVTEQLITGETKEMLVKAIRELNETDRQIVVKRYFLYESIESIAQHLGLTRQSVDNRLWRSRKALKKVLQFDGKEGLV